MQMMLQQTLFAAPRQVKPAGSEESFMLTRTVKSPNSGTFETQLVSISVKPHHGGWMWATTISSKAGFYKGYACLPKWGNFADSKSEAINRAISELGPEIERLHPSERERVIPWLSELATNN